MGKPVKSLGAVEGANLVLLIVFGILAVLELSRQNYLDGGVWGALGAALVLLNSADLSRPGAWKRPRHLLGIVLMAAAVALLAMKIAIDAAA